jgi:beta-galactosidase
MTDWTIIIKENSKMKNLLSKEYFLFGSQYYRAPSPHKVDWDRDLAKMAELGFNTVKFWVQWRWNNPQENIYYFDDIDHLMDLSEKHELRVMLNTIFDVAPAWIYQKYPDASMLTLDGRRIGPQTQPHRQIGGLGYCFNHPDVQNHFFDFLAETITRYKDHPALEIWNVGSEPELTSSMAEMRLYADNAEKMGDMLCFCDHCKTGFKKWLSEKYNHIENLNIAWNRNYQSFDHAEIPLTRNTFNDMIDWRMYFVHVLGENVKRRFEVAQEIDRGKHPLMCHHVFIQGFPVTSTANDPWNVGRYGDLHGFTQMDDPMMIDILRSCAKDKPVISAEMLMLPGYTLDLPQLIDENDVKRFIYSGLAGNLKGFIFWQYRPEILGREAPTWGLSHLDGSETPWLQAYTEAGKVLNKNRDLLLNGQPKKAEMAILYNPENQIFAWQTTKNEKSATDSLLGVHRALYENNYVIDFIHPMEFEKNVLSNYKCLYIPFPYVLSKVICDALKKWVDQGGVLIGECYLAGWNIEEGHHEKTIPGYGLDEVFQVEQYNTLPAGEEGIEIDLIKDVSVMKKGDRVIGEMIQQQLTPKGAEVVANFPDGSAAITIARYGKGTAIYIGSYLGLCYYKQNDPETGSLIASLADIAAIERPVVLGKEKIRVDVIGDKSDGNMLIIQNLSKTDVNATFKVILSRSRTFIEQYSGEKLNISSDDGNGQIKMKMKPNQVKVYVND